ncbi:hypothetical protein [Schleiferilactobacillus harbinensis]|uniref:hypothetical protein n=1 Tax=Schleiferilactobacillus harbinensis TaxID=304207 RepID=UPI0039EC1E8F
MTDSSQEKKIASLLDRAFAAYHGLIFWYDKSGQYLTWVSYFQAVSSVAVIIAGPNEQFTTKETVAQLEEKGESGLIYFHCPKPEPMTNLLVDCLYYSLELVTSREQPTLQVSGKHLTEKNIVAPTVIAESSIIDAPVKKVGLILDQENNGAILADYMMYFVDANDNVISDKQRIRFDWQSVVEESVSTLAMTIADWDFESGEICYLVITDELTGWGEQMPFEIVAGGFGNFGDELI